MLIKLTSYLACSVSVFLSVMLFSSIGQGITVYVFGMVALIIEVTKYETFKNAFSNVHCLILCVLLTLLSIGASIGSLQNGMSETSRNVSIYQEQRQMIINRMDGLNKSIDKYIEMEHVKKAIALQDDLKALESDLNALDKPKLSTSYGMVKTVSEATGIDFATVSTMVYILVAVVLDVCAFTLLWLTLPKTNNVTRNVTEVVAVVRETVVHDRELLLCIKNGEVSPSVRQVMQNKGVGYQKAKTILEQFVDAGELVRTESGRYQLK